MKDKLILVAEDDVDDQQFLKEAFESLQRHLKIKFIKSGEKVIPFLASVPDEGLPCLIILDYNLPQMNGQEILMQLKKVDRYDHIIKVVWSTSNAPFYENAARQSGAHAYYIKPYNLQGIKELAVSMLDLCEE